MGKGKLKWFETRRRTGASYPRDDESASLSQPSDPRSQLRHRTRTHTTTGALNLEKKNILITFHCDGKGLLFSFEENRE